MKIIKHLELNNNASINEMGFDTIIHNGKNQTHGCNKSDTWMKIHNLSAFIRKQRFFKEPEAFYLKAKKENKVNPKKLGYKSSR